MILYGSLSVTWPIPAWWSLIAIQTPGRKQLRSLMRHSFEHGNVSPAGLRLTGSSLPGDSPGWILNLRLGTCLKQDSGELLQGEDTHGGWALATRPNGRYQ